LKSEWFETFFENIAVDFWNRAIPASVSEQEVDFLARTFTNGSRLLDVPCGAGRHSIPLAKRGYEVTGIDLSQEFLECLEQNAQGIPGLCWRSGDMRSLELHETFDGACCMGNSFPYLDYENSNAFLRSVSNALASGAKFVLDTGVTAETMLPALPSRRWHRFDEILVLSEARYVAEASRMDIDYTFLRDGRLETRPTASYVFTAAEIRRMFERAGFEVTSMNGGFAGEPFAVGPGRLVLVAQRH
jgi:SAM-dependent methyltransferase